MTDLFAFGLFWVMAVFIGVGSYYVGRKSGWSMGYQDSCRTRDLNKGQPTFDEWIDEEARAEEIKPCLPSSS